MYSRRLQLRAAEKISASIHSQYSKMKILSYQAYLSHATVVVTASFPDVPPDAAETKIIPVSQITVRLPLIVSSCHTATPRTESSPSCPRPASLLPRCCLAGVWQPVTQYRARIEQGYQSVTGQWDSSPSPWCQIIPTTRKHCLMDFNNSQCVRMVNPRTLSKGKSANLNILS